MDEELNRKERKGPRKEAAKMFFFAWLSESFAFFAVKVGSQLILC
jgi:hypothetical protein